MHNGPTHGPSLSWRKSLVEHFGESAGSQGCGGGGGDDQGGGGDGGGGVKGGGDGGSGGGGKVGGDGGGGGGGGKVKASAASVSAAVKGGMRLGEPGNGESVCHFIDPMFTSCVQYVHVRCCG
ncbi:hypothetical protein I4F81_010369 [Pyropia yezoensis]|uniref:Uncharacterized protein n=1 Tax=Pyropia yezoensis TaxID=2788 RepID=A0ACC3CCG7_PYRYE|nr:hypothetical protein I4F81_010369 [Neopyropia yezoensis]